MTGMRLGVERQPVERVAAAGEGVELLFAEVGEERARSGLRGGTVKALIRLG